MVFTPPALGVVISSARSTHLTDGACPASWATSGLIRTATRTLSVAKDMRLPPRFGTGGGWSFVLRGGGAGSGRHRRARARAVVPQRLRCSGQPRAAQAFARRCHDSACNRQTAKTADSVPQRPPPSLPSVGAVYGPNPGHAQPCGPGRRRRAPQSTDQSAMSFGGSQPRQPHGREVSAEFRQRFAGRVNRTGRDGQLENYSRAPGGRRRRNS